MLPLLDLRSFDGDPSDRLPRATADASKQREAVRRVIADVRARGDAAVLEAGERFGGVRVEPLRVPAGEIAKALAECDPSLVAAIEAAASRIRDYHEQQASEERAPFWRIGGDDAQIGEETRPLARAGCYVPGGRAAYPSTVLMTTIPARAAGVREIAVCVPPAEGGVHRVTLAACAIAGVDEVYACGGAQAIAAMAYGTESVPRVDKIVGPGSIWVTLAKHEVAMDVGVDGFAGPTEIAIVADDSAPPLFVAADLVAQAEHDPLATCLLITPSRELIDAVSEILPKEVAAASRSEDIESALREHGRAILVDDVAAAIRVADAFAPEHLELALEDAAEWLPKVRNAGAIFTGVYAPVSLGDYAAGTNHVLPTAGSARFASPLRVSDFIKSTAIVRFTEEGLARIAPAAIAIAGEEGLDAHARALNVRLEAAAPDVSTNGHRR